MAGKQLDSKLIDCDFWTVRIDLWGNTTAGSRVLRLFVEASSRIAKLKVSRREACSGEAENY